VDRFMQKSTFKIYCFTDRFNLTELSKLGKCVNVIYRNYSPVDDFNDILNIKKFCKQKNLKFFISNNIKIAIKLGLDGIYIPSFNKNINYARKYNLPKKFTIIGSAHNTQQINLKSKQNCTEIFLSPIFKNRKSKKFLNICKFNLLTLNKKIKFIALGGVDNNNYKLIHLTNSKGFASISWAKKNGLR